MWTQRIGAAPSVESTLESALQNGELVVIINPDSSFTFEELIALSGYVEHGGKVLVLDGIDNVASTANEVLYQFNMELTIDDHLQQVIIAEDTSRQSNFFVFDNRSVGLAPQPFLSVQGGQVLLTGEYGQPIFSIQQWGDGVLAVIVDSSMFSNRIMGGVFTIPNMMQRGVYDLEYYIFENLLYDKYDVLPANITGYAYVDTNTNGQYDPSVDQALLNKNISLWKLDSLIINQSQSYTVEATMTTDEKGYYQFFQMMPGYYLVSVADQNGLLIHQSNTVLTSGTTVSYNISIQYMSSLSGIVYYDENGNSTYDLGEEMADTTVDLIMYNANGSFVSLSSVVTDQNGAYRFSSLTAGQCLLNVSKVNKTSGYLVYSMMEMVSLPVDTAKVVNVSLALASVTLYGRLTYNDEPKTDVVVSLYANLSAAQNTATSFLLAKSNASGDYTVTLQPGSYNISVNQALNENGQNNTYYYHGSLVLSVGEGLKNFDIVLSLKN
jgi:hypothetical protein